MTNATCLAPMRPASETAPGAVRPRRVTLDAARLLAAYAIVWLHTPLLPSLEASKALGRLAVPFFVFASVYFVIEGQRRRPGRTFGEYARSRFVRIYVPFLAWSGIYLLFKLLKGLLVPGQPNDYPGVEILWCGGFYHLWFMPFLLAVNLLAFSAGQATAGRPSLEKTACVAAIVAGTVLAAAPAPVTVSPAARCLPLVINALPAACWAVALALALRHWGASWIERRAVTIAGLWLVVASTAFVWRFGEARVLETLAGLGLMLVALRPATTAWITPLAKLGPLAYGIYLSHLLFLKVLESLGAKLGCGITWQRDVIAFLVSAALSTLLAWGLSRCRWTRWLVA